MAKISKPQKGQHKLFRHFAVITLIVAVGLGVVLDREGKDTAVEYLEDQQREAALQRKSAEVTSAPKLARRAKKSAGSFGNEAGPGRAFGRPMYGRTDIQSSKQEARARETLGQRKNLTGYSPDYIAALSQEEYESLEKSLDEAGLLDANTRRRQIEALQKASRSRSG